MHRIAFCALLAVAPLCPFVTDCSGAEANAGNLILNGGFEQRPAPAQGPPAGWSVYVGRANTLGIAAASRPASPGTHCLRIDTDENARTGGVRSKLIRCDASRPLTVVGWVADGGDPRTRARPHVAVAWYDAAKEPVPRKPGAKNNYVYINYRKAPEWERFVRTFVPAAAASPSEPWTIPAGATYFEVRLFAQNYPGPVWFDDITATQDADKSLSDRTEPRKLLPPVRSDAEWLITYQGELVGRPNLSLPIVADEMARYLSRVTGKRADTGSWGSAGSGQTILITDAAHAPTEVAERLEGKHRDAFRIQYPCVVDGRKLCLLVSNDPYGYDFPVYFFLNRFAAIHWLGPGQLGEIVPRIPDWTLPERIDILEDPDFEMRSWRVPGFNARRWLAGSIRYDFHHALGRVFDAKQYAGTHPEIFPLVEGVRQVPDWRKPGYRPTAGWQPCIGNPQSVEIAARHGVDLLAANRRMLSFSLSVNDGRGNQCECSRCWAMDSQTAFDSLEPDYSDRYFRFYNRVIGRALKTNSEAWLAVFSYGNSTSKPPHEVRVHPRTVVFQVDKLDPTWTNLGATAALYQNCLDRKFMTVRHAPHAQARTLRKLKKLGGVAYYGAPYTVWAAHAPIYYVLSKLLWDTDANVDAALNEYLRPAYGAEAAPHMREYFNVWESVYERDLAHRFTGRQDSMFEWNWCTKHLDFLCREDLTRMDAALDRAAARPMTQPQRKRFELNRAYYRLLRINAEQFLASREFRNPEWLAARATTEILSRMSETTGLTAAFDKHLDEEILTDETGWLLDASLRKHPARFRDVSFIRRLRPIVEMDHETSLDDAAGFLARRVLENRPAEEAVKLLEAMADRHPQLLHFLRPQVKSLKGDPQPNLIANPGFEKGTPADPSSIAGWRLSPAKGTDFAPVVYTYEDNAGRRDTRAFGVGGPSLYAGIATTARVQPGRYRLSFWYRTRGRKYTCSVRLERKAKGKRLALMTFYVDPTNEDWHHVSRSLTVGEAEALHIRLAAGWQYRRYWTWFDDVELVRID